MKIILINILLFFFLTSIDFAQYSRDSLSFITKNYEVKNLSSNFNKQLNTYNLTSTFNYGTQMGKLFVGVQEQYKSTLIKTSTKNIRDEQHLSLISEYEFATPLKVGLLSNSSIYSDDRKIDINKASNLNSSLYIKAIPVKNIKIIPFGGLTLNQQVDEDGKGFIYGSEALAEFYDINDFEIYSSLKFLNEDISPRKNALRYFNLNLNSVFETTLLNTISTSYSQLRKDFYFAADDSVASIFNVNNNIQSRIESNYFIQDRLYYTSTNSDLIVDLIGRISWRNIDRNTRYFSLNNINSSSFDTKIEEFKIDFQSSAEYRGKIFNGFLKLLFSERDEKHIAKRLDALPVSKEIFFNEREEIENQKNNKSVQTTLIASANFAFTQKDKISFSLFHRKMQYDTPSSENYDDRDEIRTMLRLSYIRKFSPLFLMYSSLEGSFDHIVYIFAERSSNNNLKRSLKLILGGNYGGKYFLSNNSFEVSANYIVYDFEDINPNFKSFSFRQFVLRDSTKLKLNKRISLAANGFIKLSEQGDFKWANFSNKPVRFLSNIELEPKIYYSINNMRFGVGFRYFILNTFLYNEQNEKALDSKYRSIGPLSEIVYVVQNKINLRISGWYEFIRDEKNKKREQANIFIQIDWNL